MRFSRKQFVAWLTRTRKDAGQPPLSARHMENCWQSYKRQSSAADQARVATNNSATLLKKTPDATACNHDWNREHYGLRCLRCQEKMTGDPVKLWKRVVLKIPPAPRPVMERPPCEHVWAMKPYGLRCKRKLCRVKMKGDPAALWKKHGPPGRMPPLPQPLPQKTHKRSRRAHKRAEHRARQHGITLEEKEKKQQLEKARKAASRQFNSGALLRETGLREMGVLDKHYQGAPAWHYALRTHPSSDRGA